MHGILFDTMINIWKYIFKEGATRIIQKIIISELFIIIIKVVTKPPRSLTNCFISRNISKEQQNYIFVLC